MGCQPMVKLWFQEWGTRTRWGEGVRTAHAIHNNQKIILFVMYLEVEPLDLVPATNCPDSLVEPTCQAVGGYDVIFQA